MVVFCVLTTDPEFATHMTAILRQVEIEAFVAASWQELERLQDEAVFSAYVVDPLHEVT